MSDANVNNLNKSSVQLLQEINSGVLNPSLLDKPSRQQCVELLIMEGYTQAHIAQVLKCSEKTVSRDVKEIHVRNELSPNIQFAKEFIGDFFKKAMNHYSYIMRQARDRDNSSAEKAQTEFCAWRVLKELVEKLQSLGYLPQVAQRIEGEFFHHRDDETAEKSLSELRKSLSDIETATKETGAFDAEVQERIQQIKLKIEKAEIESEIDTLNKNQKQNYGGQNESENQ